LADRALAKGKSAICPDMSRAEGSGVAALLKDFRQFAGPRLWSALALMLLGAVAEGFGLLMIVPLATIALGQKTETLGRFSGWADRIPPDQRFFAALALFVAAMAARSALLYARDVQLAWLQASYEASLRLRASATLARRGWPFASRIGQAGMQSLLLTDVSRASIALAEAQLVAVNFVMLAVQFVLTLFLSPALALIALAIVVFGSLIAVRWIRRGVRSGIVLTKQFEQSTSSGFRLHAGLKAALAQGTVPPFIEEYAATLKRQMDELIRFTRDLSSARQLAALAAAAAAALLLYVGVRVLALPFPVLIASLVLFARMTNPALSLQQAVQHTAAFAPAFAAIARRLGKLEPQSDGEAPLPPLDWAELSVEGAAFDHQAGLGLRDASFSLASGEWIGIAGPSGSGKTTLVDLVAGLMPPDRGEIRIDGRGIDGDALRRWRAGLAYVGQEGLVFNDSVRGNLLAEGASAEDSRLWQILGTVGLAERVKTLPNGLDESVGDRGSQLSGGERQRLVVARALLRNPSLLILDEATAALDAEGESELFDRLRALDPRPAALVVAHRDSTLAHCDSVLSIQHGIVKKSGDPSRLRR
jgi:ABC-type multidrug transport system fused ATPase/permease subunit